MTISHLVNPSQRWRVVSGYVPGCPVGTIVSLATTGDRLEVGRSWFGVVAQLDLRNATIAASPDGHELTLGAASGEVIFQNDDALAAVGRAAQVGPAGRLAPGEASFIGQVVQFGTQVPNADGWNLFVFLVLRRIDGWLVGLTQAGRPIGIAESNIAWWHVLDHGPRLPSDRLVLTYVGSRTHCERSFQSDVATLRELGYEVANQHFLQEPRSPALIIAGLLIGLLLAFVLIGIAIIAALILVKPPGVLTVTLRRQHPVGS